MATTESCLSCWMVILLLRLLRWIRQQGNKWLSLWMGDWIGIRLPIGLPSNFLFALTPPPSRLPIVGNLSSSSTVGGWCSLPSPSLNGRNYIFTRCTYYVNLRRSKCLVYVCGERKKEKETPIILIEPLTTWFTMKTKVVVNRGLRINCYSPCRPTSWDTRKLFFCSYGILIGDK